MRDSRFGWLFSEISAPIGGLAVCSFLMLSTPTASAWKLVALLFYIVATMTSIAAGGRLKDLGKTTKDVTRLNNRIHKWSVLTLNGFVGIGCVIYLWRHQGEAVVPITILGSFFTLYILSWTLRIIRPHSFWARFRSVLLRAVLMTVMVGIMWKHGYLLAPIAAVPFLIMAWRHLRRDQRRFGWAER